MYVKGKNRGGQSPALLPTHPKKHHKPYRIRHMGLFVGGVLVVILSALAAGYQLGQSRVLVADSSGGGSSPAKTTTRRIKSGLGYSFSYDSTVFSAKAKADDRTAGNNELSKSLDLSEVKLTPKTSSVNGQEALSSLTIGVETDDSAFARFKVQNGYSDPDEAAASYFAPVDDQNFNVEKKSESEQIIGSLKFQKTTYVQKPRFSSSAEPIYSIVWTGILKGRPIQLRLDGLLSAGQIPAIYTPILDSLYFGKGSRPDVLSDTTTDGQNFDINRISPAVVKIYHFVCGTLFINDQSYGEDACDGGTGSGFLVSGDGYIATSGHVVVLDAADILVNELLADPDLLLQFTQAAGLNAEQSAQNGVVASLLAKIYDLPKSKLRLENRHEVTFASLGNNPLPDSTQAEIRKAMNMSDGDSIKRADIVAVNYQPKDLLVIEQNTQKGFSASDVALLKVKVADSPYIRMADSSKLEQNSPVNLIGFPADADNQLTDNSIISPSITSGTISSIRRANGSSSQLFQTDADASAGNSGGPAITAEGKVFGLVTYRFKSGESTNAAKSYIRDIADFASLVDSKNISLSVKSPTQSAWEAGLDLFSQQRYSKALIQFGKVQNLYPAQRLVGSYIAQAQQAIRDGKDKKDPPYLLVAIITGGLIGGLMTALATYLIIRHRRAHIAYKAANMNAQNIVNPVV